MKKLKPLLALAITLAALAGCYYKEPATVAAVVPVDHQQDLYQSLRSGHKPSRPLPAAKRELAVHGENEPAVVVEGHRSRPVRTKKVFTAAQFVCALPIENADTYTVILNNPEDAADAILRMKKEGCDEITVKNTQPGEVLDAIVKTAKQHDIRINA